MPPVPITWALQILRSWFPRNENVYQGAYSIWSSDCNLAILDLDSLVAQRLKCLPAMRETWVRSLGWEDPLEKEMATHPSTPPPVQYSCLENPMDGGAWWATVHGVAESDMTEWLHLFNVIKIRITTTKKKHCTYWDDWSWLWRGSRADESTGYEKMCTKYKDYLSVTSNIKRS